MGDSGPQTWLITDGLPGHSNQLLGLGERLKALGDAQLTWIDARDHPLPAWRALLGFPPPLDYPSPDLILAAGHGTHRLLLASRRAFNALTVVLMKPSFPLHWVDLAIIPAHDRPPARENILTTLGVLNPVLPNPDVSPEHRGLLLIGGPSRHYHWDDEALVQQIIQLVDETPGWHWSLATSRRTPRALLQQLGRLAPGNLRLFPQEALPAGWIHHQFAQNRVAWVTPDSVSMLYEALTAGLPTGIFELEPRGEGRILAGIRSLEEQGWIASWSDRRAVLDANPHNRPRLWEANRAAGWLLDKLRENA